MGKMHKFAIFWIFVTLYNFEQVVPHHIVRNDAKNNQRKIEIFA